MTSNLNELQFNLNSLKSLAGSFGSFGSTGSTGSSYTNSIFTLLDQGQNAINCGDEGKASAITSLVENLISMVSSIHNESAKAQKEVSRNTKKSDDLDNKVDETANDIEEQVKEIVGNIGTEVSSINNALEEIEKLGGEEGKSGELAEIQEELQKQLEIIDENKEIVNDGVSSTEAKQAALDKILEASGVISNLVVSVQEIQEKINEQNEIVENASENVSNLVTDSVNVIEGGAEALASLQTTAAGQIATNTKSATVGTADETAGASLVASGSATSWVPIFGQTASQKAILTGQDLLRAGATRISGSAQNIASISKTIGTMGQTFTKFNDYLGSVSNAGTECADLVGSYGTITESLITATGSWTAIAQENTVLEKEVDNAREKLSLNNDNKGFYEKENENKSDSKSQFNGFAGNTIETNAKSERNAAGESDGNQVFNYNTQNMKKVFGI